MLAISAVALIKAAPVGVSSSLDESELFSGDVGARGKPARFGSVAPRFDSRKPSSDLDMTIVNMEADRFALKLTANFPEAKEFSNKVQVSDAVVKRLLLYIPIWNLI